MCADATRWSSDPVFDLVVLAYLQLPADERRAAVIRRPPRAAYDHHVVEIAGAIAELVLVARFERALSIVARAQRGAVHLREPPEHERCERKAFESR